MRRALVLAGGGARGAFQVGMLRNLVVDRGLDFQIIRGISVGALNAACLAQAHTRGDSLAALQEQVQLLEQIWRTRIKGSNSVFRKRLCGVFGLVFGANSIYSVEPLVSLIHEFVSIGRLRISGRDFRVGTVSLLTGRYQEWGPDDPAFIEKLLASASIPCVFPFVRTRVPQEDVLVDGGVRNITPLSSVFDAEPDEVYVLLTSMLKPTRGGFPDSGVREHPIEKWRDNLLGLQVSGFTVLERTIEILTDEIYLDDIRGALAWNRVLGAVEYLQSTLKKARESIPDEVWDALGRLKESTKKRYVPIRVLAPLMWYGAENSSTDFSPGLIEKAIEHGYEVAADERSWLVS